MVDPIAVETGDETPAAPPPVPTQAQIDAEIERKANEKANAIADKRIAGLMSANDKKVAALEATYGSSSVSLSNEDDDGVRSSDRTIFEAELARVQREAPGSRVSPANMRTCSRTGKPSPLPMMTPHDWSTCAR